MEIYGTSSLLNTNNIIPICNAKLFYVKRTEQIIPWYSIFITNTSIFYITSNNNIKHYYYIIYYNY